MVDSLKVILYGIASFFLNPILYLLFIALFVYSAQRVRRERRSFRVKAYGMFNSIFASIGPSLLIGMMVSVVLVLAGVSLKPGVLVLFSAGYLVTLLICQQRFLSPALASGITLAAAYFMPVIHTDYPLVNSWIIDIHRMDYLSFGIFMTICLLAETALVFFWGASQTSPRLISSHRGGLVGAHEACQLWIAPILFLVPMPDAVGAIGHWPFVSSGASFGFALFPLGIGFAQLITHELPAFATRQTSRWMLLTACATAIFSGVFYFIHLPLLIVIGGLIALVSRLTLVWYHHHLRETRPFCFLMPNNGLRVIGTIPHSLGARMGIEPGEEICRVNDQEISSVYEFYEALQKHAAYCKLEVIDRFGQQRFAKGPIHEDDDHKIGLLFLESDHWKFNQKTNL
ncbi:cell division protein [Sporolactobacillus kofuensis]|uniref:Cell division protein n=1 Tax=Sporolactobacillus kofuensis TaxID=269672 RepID=A0ABW1WIY7_9BACL|nr:cell division protein [Sporolactobacillus kofuensis]MCO7176460.1 cell division protein [Sporolactobacillus kofuensis]